MNVPNEHFAKIYKNDIHLMTMNFGNFGNDKKPKSDEELIHGFHRTIWDTLTTNGRNIEMVSTQKWIYDFGEITDHYVDFICKIKNEVKSEPSNSDFSRRLTW